MSQHRLSSEIDVLLGELLDVMDEFEKLRVRIIGIAEDIDAENQEPHEYGGGGGR